MKYCTMLALCIIVCLTFNAQTFNITKHGVVGDGKTNCTQALQTAIDSCN